MQRSISDLPALLRGLRPELHDGTYVFASLSPDHAAEAMEWSEVVAFVREEEGLSVVVSEGYAQRAGLRGRFRCRWITLRVRSDLHAVGLTAAFSTALAEAGIGCNVIAGACHDHLFVAAADAERALAELRRLQAGADSRRSGA